MRHLCFPEPLNVLGPAAVLSFCQCIHTVHSLVSCQDPWDYRTSRAAFSARICGSLWRLGHLLWGMFGGLGLGSA